MSGRIDLKSVRLKTAQKYSNWLLFYLFFQKQAPFSVPSYMGGKPGGTLWDKMNYVVGAEYGYSLPIARRWNIDFTIGAGYWGGIYHEYLPQDGEYVWQATKKRQWIGPTKAEISLVWLLGKGNCNQGKSRKKKSFLMDSTDRKGGGDD